MPFCGAPVDIVPGQICVIDLGLTLGDLVGRDKTEGESHRIIVGCCCDCSEKYFGEAVSFSG